MKKIILLASLVFVSSHVFPVQAENEVDYQSNYINFQRIEDGWYIASVNYFNSRTSVQITNTLNVRVESNRVTAIDFRDGTVLHAGIQNSGYIFSGGYLSVDRAFNSSHIIGVSGKVIVSYRNSRPITYEIMIR